jgi:K+ transporter
MSTLVTSVDHHHPAHPTGAQLRRLALLALGVIYGDIGTSPLYAIKECFGGEHAVAISHDNVLGILSLVFWTLVMTVTIKYHVYVIRADNRGEGGILALTSLIHTKFGDAKLWWVQPCSTATGRSRRRSPCSRPSRAWMWPPTCSTPTSCR